MPTTPSVEEKKYSPLWRLVSAGYLGRQVTAQELAEAGLELELLLAVSKGAKEVLWANKEYGPSSGDMARALTALGAAFDIHK